MAYVVSQRTQEIGIRMALGALPSTILMSVLGGALLTMMVGPRHWLDWRVGSFRAGARIPFRSPAPRSKGLRRRLAGARDDWACRCVRPSSPRVVASTLSLRFGWSETRLQSPLAPRLVCDRSTMPFIRIGLWIALLTGAMLLPFLPGRHDPLAVSLSAAATGVAFAGSAGADRRGVADLQPRIRAGEAGLGRGNARRGRRCTGHGGER